MAKPKQEISHTTYFKDIHFLYEIFTSLKTTEELKLFIKDILTRSELRMLKRLWHIANLLYEGHDVRTVALKSKTSTTTVIKVKKILEEGYGGLQLALKRADKKIAEEKEKQIRLSKQPKSSKFVKGWFGK